MVEVADEGGRFVPIGHVVKSLSIVMSANVGPFTYALERLGETITRARDVTASFTTAFRQNRRRIRRLFGIAEPRPRRRSSPHRRKHPAIRRRATSSQTRRVRRSRPR